MLRFSEKKVGPGKILGQSVAVLPGIPSILAISNHSNPGFDASFDQTMKKHQRYSLREKAPWSGVS
jgi:hypothetical protein